MKEKIYILILITLWIMTTSTKVISDDRWQSSFDTTAVFTEKLDTVLTIDEVLNLVAFKNPSLRSLDFMREAANSRLIQAGLRQNPQLGVEFEEVGWDAPGFSESEITIALSQEFEIFGQRNARKQVALADINSTDFEIKLTAFDLYLVAKSRFNKLIHSQIQKKLADSSVVIAENIKKSIEYRMKQGVVLQSELLLAQLELQRVDLTSMEAQHDLLSARMELGALWNSNTTNITVNANEELDFQTALNILPTLILQIDSTRYIRQLQHEKIMIGAEKQLASAEAKPGITLSGGFRRIEVDNSHSFLFGVSLPLPLFNKNQGETASLEAMMRSNEYEQKRARLETKAFINASISKLHQLINSHNAIDALLLPTAEDTYKALRENYNVGRIPYTSLLEAERSLIELRFEHNDVLFDIYQQLIALEQISGIRLY